MNIEITKDQLGDYSWRFTRNGETYQDHGFISAISAERDAKSVFRCLERGVKLGDDYYPIHGVDAEVACHVNAEHQRN